jgi:hypothetical protein
LCFYNVHRSGDLKGNNSRSDWQIQNPFSGILMILHQQIGR